MDKITSLSEGGTRCTTLAQCVIISSTLFNKFCITSKPVHNGLTICQANKHEIPSAMHNVLLKITEQKRAHNINAVSSSAS